MTVVHLKCSCFHSAQCLNLSLWTRPYIASSLLAVQYNVLLRLYLILPRESFICSFVPCSQIWSKQKSLKWWLVCSTLRMLVSVCIYLMMIKNKYLRGDSHFTVSQRSDWFCSFVGSVLFRCSLVYIYITHESPYLIFYSFSITS